MYYIVINVGTDRPYKNHGHKEYKTEAAAKAQVTRLNKEYGNTVQWKVITSAEYYSRPVKMVERINLMSGLPYMEAEDTPNFCSPSSETYWSM